MSFDLVVATSVLLALAAACTRLMRRASAASRHLVWTAALVAAVAMPAARALLPPIDVPVLTPGVTIGVQPAAIEWQASASIAAPPALPPSVNAAARALPPAEIVAGAWLAGVGAILFWYAAGTLGVWRLSRRSPLGPGEIQERAADHARAAGVARRVQVRVAPDDRVPMTWGLLRPTILLPARWTSWLVDKLDAVLAHEVAHAARFDVVAHRIARLAAALHWFNPLAWYAVQQAQLERERACDDLVLRSGTPASSYAGELVEFARALSAPAAVLPMARRSRLEARVMAILDPRTNRKGTSVVVAVLTVLLVIAAGIGSVIRLSAYDLPPVPERISFPAERPTDTRTHTDFSGTWVAINADIAKLADSYFRAGTSSAPASFTIAQNSRDMIFVRHAGQSDIASSYSVSGFSFTNVLSPLHKTERGLGTWQSGAFVVGFENGDFLVFSMKDAGILRLDQTGIRPLLFRKASPPQTLPPPPPPAPPQKRLPPPPPPPPPAMLDVQVSSAQQGDAAKCAAERARAAAAGWDVSNLSFPCDPGVKAPNRTQAAKPQYTLEAMRQRIEGSVELQGVVDVDGIIREPRIMRSLDKTYGLDDQARKAVEAMRFEPATKDGKPVRALVMIELMFSLQQRPPQPPPPPPPAQNPPPPPPPAPALNTSAARAARCEWEHDEAVKAGWNMTDVHLPCEPGLEWPVRTRAVNAAYTPEALRAKIQGVVKIAALVDTDGVVREARVVDSLDKVFGLDDQALKAVRATTFTPGKLKGAPVKVLMEIDMAFALR